MKSNFSYLADLNDCKGVSVKGAGFLIDQSTHQKKICSMCLGEGLKKWWKFPLKSRPAQITDKADSKVVFFAFSGHNR